MSSSSYIPKEGGLFLEPIDQLVLSEYPYPIAVNYRRMLEADNWERRTWECINVFEYSIRASTLSLLSQYLIQDRDAFSDPELNQALYRTKLSNVSLGTWVNYLFLTLKAYGGRRELFFMQELYDLYWDTSRMPHQPRRGVRSPFDRLVEMRNTLVHQRAPKDEKGWEKLGWEALKNLQQVMTYFSFLKNYDLVRVVHLSGEEYKYERFTGQAITSHQDNLKSKEKIQPGWFYLSRQDHTLLGLHPLLIFWSGSRIEGKEAEEQDVAVFEELLKDTAGYFATVARDVLKEHDTAAVAQLRELIYYNLEQVKMKMARQQVKLSWESVWNAVREVSSEQMGTAQKKYNPILYIQREGILKKFQDFLGSDKTCFVLTGKSGVGKSNFVLSLADMYAKAQHVGVLIYNGARLDISSMSVAQMISQDLGKLIQSEKDELTSVFAALDKSEDMTGHQLIVIFDAINENTNPKEVLQKIDQMVKSERYSWLKVLITSRPEGWRTMKRGLPLTDDHYYREQGSEAGPIEFEEFAVKLDIFERNELQAAYEKYRRYFNIQTEYSTLTPAVRNALRDPLMLRLIVEIYKDKLIPDHIQVNDLHKYYLDSLINASRLHRKDIIFLEQELMPLMLRTGYYDNKLTASEIQIARTKDGRPIWELIHSSDSLGGGQRVNDSYVRLRDTELLDQIGSGMDYVIAFKYERFYEFFASRRISNLSRAHPNLILFYIDLIEMLSTAPYLRNSIKSLLLDAVTSDNMTIILELCFTPHQPVTRMMIDVLSELGKYRLDVLEKVLSQLITPENKSTFFEKVKKVLNKSTAASEIGSRSAKKIAIQVAGNLGAPWVLFYGLSENKSELGRGPRA